MPPVGDQISREYPAEAGQTPGSSKIRLRSLNDLDRRTRSAQVALKLRDELFGDLGGSDRVSTAKRVLVENAALLGAAIQANATAFLSGGDADLSELVLLVNAQRRLLADLGLERSARDVTPPSIDDYLDHLDHGRAP